MVTIASRHQLITAGAESKGASASGARLIIILLRGADADRFLLEDILSIEIVDSPS